MSRRARIWLAAALLLAAAGALRALALGWDSGIYSPHPDERTVATAAGALDHPFADPGFFAYGTLHLRLVRAVTGAAGWAPAFDRLIAGGRLLSLAASLLALGVGALLAARAWGRRTALLFLALAACLPLDLQQSHYATVEAHQGLWTLAVLAACLALAERPGAATATAAGAALGAALAVKLSALALVLPLALALALGGRRRGAPPALPLGLTAASAAVAALWLGQPWTFAGGRPPLALVSGSALAALLLGLGRGPRLAGAGIRLALALGILAGAVALTAALGGLHEEWRQQIGAEVAMTTGAADVPYVRVYRHTPALLYPLRQLGLFGLGPGLLAAAAVAAVAGLGVAWRRRRRWLGALGSGGRRPGRGDLLLLLLLVWLLPLGLRLATLEVKFLRYWQPLAPALALLAAWWLARLPRRLRRGLGAAVVGLTLLWGVGVVWGVASEPHPRATALRFLAGRLAPGATLAFEDFEDTLRLGPPLREVDLPSYRLPDDAAKVRAWSETLAAADWVVLLSHRVRRTVLENPDLYPATGRLYARLLGGEAGFEPLGRIERAPRIAGWPLAVERADESFVSYEFPRVVLLRRSGPVEVESWVADALAGEPPAYADLERRVAERFPRIRALPPGARRRTDLAFAGALLLLAALAGWSLFGRPGALRR